MKVSGRRWGFHREDVPLVTIGDSDVMVLYVDDLLVCAEAAVHLWGELTGPARD
jgi:hypothetical protein